MKRLFKRMSLAMVMVIFVFIIMSLTFFIMGFCVFGAIRLLNINPFRGPNLSPVIGLLLISVVLGTALTGMLSKRLLRPMRQLIDAHRRVAAGDFTVRLEGESVPEMEDLMNSFNTMVGELGSIETLRSDFVSNFSHEFKTPIVSIRGFAKLLQDEDLSDEDRREYVDIIVQESQRLAGLSSNVLDLSRLENTGILTEKAYFFLDEQIRRVAALMEPRWRDKGIAVTLEMDSVTLYSDEDLLQQVWVSLLDNAVKYTGEGGHIALTLQRMGETARFTVTDDGAGMDEQTKAHLFDKFFQGDKSHADSGNGLGLPLVKRVLSLCEGDIQVQSEPGRGSAFTVTLPLGREN